MMGQVTHTNSFTGDNYKRSYAIFSLKYFLKFQGTYVIVRKYLASNQKEVENREKKTPALKAAFGLK